MTFTPRRETLPRTARRSGSTARSLMLMATAAVLAVGAAAAEAASTSADPSVREAAAARAEQRRHGVDDGITPAQLQANALARCTVHRDADDRAACEAIVRGEGTSSGSVQGGGVLYELVTRTVGDPGDTTAQPPRPLPR